MNRVGQVNDYEQWAADANRGQDERLTTTAASRTHAAQAQRLSDAQVDNDRHHTYYYVPRSDDRGAAYYYYYPVLHFARHLPAVLRHQC